VNQIQTQAIVLTRTDYGEADRIITLLTPDQGKLRLMARGVRKPKSKLAGGIELFSISDITFIRGRGEIGTLVSSRLHKYYDAIIQDIGRVQLGYDLIKMLNRATEDHPEAEYFQLLDHAFQALNNPGINLDLIRVWFEAQLLRQAGHSLNLHSDVEGKKLQSGENYSFDFEAMAFELQKNGHFNAKHIKILRLLFSHHLPHVLGQVQGLTELLPDLTPLMKTMLTEYIRA
jgi:DNA repair protein RecO